MHPVWRETSTDVIEYIANFVDDIDVHRAMHGRPRKLTHPLPDINFPKTPTEMWFREDGSWYAVVCVNEPAYHTRVWVRSRV